MKYKSRRKFISPTGFSNIPFQYYSRLFLLVLTLFAIFVTFAILLAFAIFVTFCVLVALEVFTGFHCFPFLRSTYIIIFKENNILVRADNFLNFLKILEAFGLHISFAHRVVTLFLGFQSSHFRVLGGHTLCVELL